eukprot:3415714-Prymnesium_polylepis.1
MAVLSDFQVPSDRSHLPWGLSLRRGPAGRRPGLRLVCIGVSVERVGSLGEWLSHHSVVRG